MLVLKQFRYLLAALLFTSLANYVSATPAVEQFHLRFDGSSLPLDNTPLPLFINNQNTSIPVDFANRQHHRIHITSLTDSRPVTITLLFDGPLVLHDTNEDIDASVYNQNDGFYRVQIHLPGGETQNNYDLMLTGDARLITDKLEAEVPKPMHSHSDQARQKRNCLSDDICDLDYLIRYQPPGEQYIQQQQTCLQNPQTEDVIVMMMSVAGSSDNNPPGKDDSKKPDRADSSKKTPARDDQESSEDKQKKEGDKENKTNPPEQQENNEGDSDQEALSNLISSLMQSEDTDTIATIFATALFQGGSINILMINGHRHLILESFDATKKMGAEGFLTNDLDERSNSEEESTIALVKQETTMKLYLVLEFTTRKRKMVAVDKKSGTIQMHCNDATKPKHNNDKRDPDGQGGGSTSDGSPVSIREVRLCGAM